jgi:hypothetical protein
LSPAEASEALGSWSLWQPAVAGADWPPGSPAYTGLTALLTQLIGDGDGAMRLLPALFGVAIVLLPRLLRHRIGRLGALVASLLLAVSPTHTMASRTAGGVSVAVFATLLVAIAWIRLQESWQVEGGDGPAARRWLTVFFVALGLGLSSAPLFYGGVVTALLGWLAQRVVGPSTFGLWPPEGLRPSRPVWQGAALAGVVTFLGAASLFMLFPAGLGAAARLPADWLRLFSLEGDALVWLSPILGIGRYESILLALGIGAILWATWRSEALPTFLTYWFIGGLILILLQRGQMSNLLLLTLPGYLLIALLLDSLFQRTAGRPAGWLLLGLMVAGATIYIHLIAFLRQSLFAPDDYSHLYFAAVVLAAALFGAYYVAMLDRRAAVQGTVGAVFILFTALSWSTAWWLSHHGANDPRDRWVGRAADDEIHLLGRTLRQFSFQAGYGANGLPVLSTVDNPTLRWHLRDFANARFEGGIPEETTVEAIITPLGAELGLPTEYTGSDFGVTRPEMEHLLSPLDTLRWWAFHQSPILLQEERMILWLRSDLLTRS